MAMHSAKDAITVVPIPRDVKNSYIDHLYDSVQSHGNVTVARFSLQVVVRCITDQPCILHVHWPEAIYNKKQPYQALRRAFFGLLVHVNKLRGGRLVWTVHNLDFHDPVGILQTVPQNSTLLRHCNGFIFLNRSTSSAFFSRYPSVVNRCRTVIPHGHYRVRPATSGKAQHTTIVLCGNVRAYKGFSDFAEIFLTINDPDLRLIVAGSAGDDGEAEALRRLAARDSRIRLDFRFLPEQEMADLVASSHCCVLPYRKAENSGAALFALSLGVPLLAPGFPALRELRDTVGNRWVTLYEPPLDSSTTVEFLNALKADPSNIRPDMTHYLWEQIGRDTLQFYHDVIDSPND